MHGRVFVQKAAAGAHFDGQQLAQIAFSQQPLNRLIYTEGKRRGYNLRDQMRLGLRRIAHEMGFGGVHRHACFTHDVLAGSQGSHRQAAVHVGPGADDNGIDVRRIDQIRPAFIDMGNLELGRHPFTGGATAVANRNNFNTFNRLQAGNMF